MVIVPDWNQIGKNKAEAKRLLSRFIVRKRRIPGIVELSSLLKLRLKGTDEIMVKDGIIISGGAVMLTVEDIRYIEEYIPFLW